MRRISLKQQILCRTAMDFDIPPSNPEEPPGDHDTNIQVSLVTCCHYVFVYLFIYYKYLHPGLSDKAPRYPCSPALLLQEDAFT